MGTTGVQRKEIPPDASFGANDFALAGASNFDGEHSPAVGSFCFTLNSVGSLVATVLGVAPG